MTTPLIPMANHFAEDPDDPLALPFPAHTLLLEEGTGLPRDRPSLVLRLLRQQLAELGLDLRLREGAGEIFELEGFRVQLVCAPFWAEDLAVPPQPWRSGDCAPHLLLAAWVDEECGAVRLPGPLTAAELRARCPGFPESDSPPSLPVAAFHGGLDRLWLLVRLLSPDALLSPLPIAAPLAVRLRDWLDGVLAETLVALGAELLPASAGAFRSPASPEPSAALASVVIPLALVRGRIEAGPARWAASERFRLLLWLCGAAQGAQWLEVRLEPELPGDLLPQRLTLRVGERAIETGDDGGTGPLSLTVRGEEAIAIGLWHADGSQLALPLLRLERHPGGAATV